MISRLHYITQDIAGFTHAELAELACRGGVDWVQLRVKNKNEEEWIEIAAATQKICKRYGAKLIINDNVFIAKEIKADGVHLGQQDMSPKEAREILGKGSIIGGSTNTPEDVRWMVQQEVDYVGIGPYTFTSTKDKLNPVLGIEGIRAVIGHCTTEKINIPFIAIGGIRIEDIPLLLDAGAHGIAVSSGINKAENKSEAAAGFLKILQKPAELILGMIKENKN
jgi:thiamine-phosphate pyrophosphorylase